MKPRKERRLTHHIGESTFVLGLTTLLSLHAQDAFALPNNGRIPILTYHGWTISDHPGLQANLELLDSRGFKVIPLWWATQWMLGTIDGSSIPKCVVAITFDDGHFSDWHDWPEHGVLSFRQILENFKATHDQPNTHAASFVVGSPTARNWMNAELSEDWWAAANSSGIIEIYNHGADHDDFRIDDANQDRIPDFPSGHCSLLDTSFEPDTYVATGDPSGQGGMGLGDWTRNNTFNQATRAIKRSGDYIATKISPAYPDLFAYPFKDPDPYISGVYMPGHTNEHNIVAAFTGAPDPFQVPPTNMSNYMTRSTNRWLVPRFVRGYHFENSNAPQFTLTQILEAVAIAHGGCP